jgi:hypothetical protein
MLLVQLFALAKNLQTTSAAPRSIATVPQSDAAAVEHQAKRKRDLDLYYRIDRLTATLSRRRSVPCRDGLFGTPNRQLSPPHQRSVIVWPISHSAARPGPNTAVATA